MLVSQGHYSAKLAAGLIKLPSKDDMFKQWFKYTKHLTPKAINFIGYDNTVSIITHRCLIVVKNA